MVDRITASVLHHNIAVCKNGLELEGFQNNRRGNSAQKYWKLPVETGEPLEWWPVKAVAGHCRMKRVDGLSMCYNRVQSDWKKILDDYHEAMDQDGSDQCCCKQCNYANKAVNTWRIKATRRGGEERGSRGELRVVYVF
jgi:hypothetical protein